MASAVTVRAAEKERATHHTVRFMTESGYPLEIRTMAFSPDGSVLAVSVSQKGLSLIRTKDGETVTEYKASPFSMSYSRDGSRILLMSESRIEVLDPDLKNPISSNGQAEPGFTGVTLQSRNGKLLVSQVSSGGPVARSGKVNVGDELVAVGEGKNGTMRRVVGFSEQRAIELIKGVAGTYLQIEVIPKGELESTVVTLRRDAKRQEGGETKFVPFTSADEDENLAWCMSDNRHTLFSASTGKPVSVLQPEDVEQVGQNALSPDCKTFALLAKRRDGSGKESAIELFSVGSRERLGYASFPKDTWCQIAFSGDSSKLLIGTWDTVEVMDVKSREFLKPLTLGWESPSVTKKADDDGPKGSAASVAQAAADRNAFPAEDPNRSPQRLVACLACSSRDIVATGDLAGQVSLWDLASGKLVDKMPCTEEKKVQTVRFSPDGKWLAYYVEGVLHLVDVSKVGGKPKDK